MSERNPFGQKNDGGWCECSDCGRRFGGLSGYDVHLSRAHPDGSDHGNKCNCSDWWPRCLSDAQLESKGPYLNDSGVWVRRWGTETAVQAAPGLGGEAA